MDGVTKKLIVAVIGAPNSGKSSLINHMTNNSFCIVSNKPHTTRVPVMAVLTNNNTQIVFVDTPGIGQNTQTEELKKITIRHADYCDLIMFIFDGAKRIPLHMLEFYNDRENKIAVINKIDTFSKGKLLPITQFLQQQKFNDVFYTSAVTGDGTTTLYSYLFNKATDGEWDYQSGQLTNRSIEQIINDKLQESIFRLTYQEIPYNTSSKVQSIRYINKNEINIQHELFLSKRYCHIFLPLIKIISTKTRLLIKDTLKKKVHYYLHINFR